MRHRSPARRTFGEARDGDRCRVEHVGSRFLAWTEEGAEALSCPGASANVRSRFLRRGQAPPSGRCRVRAGEAGIYLATGAVQKAAVFFLLPLLVGTLTAAEFSKVGLYLSVVAIVPRIASLNMHSASARLVFDYATAAEQGSMLLSSLAASLAAACVFALVTAIPAVLGWWVDPVTEGDIGIAAAVAIGIIATVIVQFCQNVSRVFREPLVFAGVSLSQGIGTVACYLVMAVILGGSYRLVTVSYAGALTVSAIYGILRLRVRLRGSLSREYITDAFHFAWPTALNFAGVWLINSSGRWIGAAFHPLEELAAYTLVTMVVSGIGVLGRAMFDAQLPHIGMAFASNEFRAGHAIVGRTALMSCGLVTLAYGALMVVMRIAPVPEAYRLNAGLLFAAWIISINDCMYLYGMQLLTAIKRTKKQAASTIVAGAAVVPMSILLVRQMGPSGLLLATAVGSCIQAAAPCAVARRELARLDSSLRIWRRGGCPS